MNQKPEASPFDKFIDDIVMRERKQQKKNTQTIESPTRKYVNRYTERAGNRIRIK